MKQFPMLTEISAAFFLVGLSFCFPFFAHAYCEDGTEASISQYGITWTFDKEYRCGQFVNGDYWVLDEGAGVKLVDILPKSTLVDGVRAVNGSMLNPSELGVQGYDGAVNNWAYDPALNVARPNGSDISASNPYLIKGSNSLVSTKTNSVANTRPQLVDAAVLTVLTSVPAAGSFRPPYSGTDKNLHWNTSSIQWNRLPKLPRAAVANLPDLALLASKIQRVWLDHGGGTWIGREIHPTGSMPDYGRDMANITGDAALALLLDYSQDEIRTLLTEYLQLGIDWYGVTENAKNLFNTTTQGNFWMGGGGHGMGRKWPMAFAGLMLGDSNILKYANAANYPIYQEEQQYFYVSQKDVDLARYTADGRPRSPYTADMIGTPEWGESHLLSPQRDGSNWDTAYRDIVSRSMVGHDLAATIMGAKPMWNWNAFFDYQDRWAAHQMETGQTISYTAFTDSMWKNYRSKYSGSSLNRADVDNSSSITGADALLVLRKSLNLSMAGTAWQASATTGDADCNGSVNAADALLILRYSLGLDMGASAWCAGK